MSGSVNSDQMFSQRLAEQPCICSVSVFAEPYAQVCLSFLAIYKHEATC